MHTLPCLPVYYTTLCTAAPCVLHHLVYYSTLCTTAPYVLQHYSIALQRRRITRTTALQTALQTALRRPSHLRSPMMGIGASCTPHILLCATIEETTCKKCLTTHRHAQSAKWCQRNAPPYTLSSRKHGQNKTNCTVKKHIWLMTHCRL